jgi:hypothetical protein
MSRRQGENFAPLRLFTVWSQTTTPKRSRPS